LFFQINSNLAPYKITAPKKLHIQKMYESNPAKIPVVRNGLYDDGKNGSMSR
jgi:hypothetical protein